MLSSDTRRKIEERKVHESARPISKKSRCRVAVRELRSLVGSDRPAAQTPRTRDDGKPGKTPAQEASSFLRALKAKIPGGLPADAQDVEHDIQWRHAQLADLLIGAGHILQAREFADGLDVFKAGKVARWEALGPHGNDLDDRAAYPTAGLHMIPIGKEMVETYLQHKNAILAAGSLFSRTLKTQWYNAAPIMYWRLPP